jgi:kinesin family member 18/19
LTARTHRRSRSPTAATMAGSPPNENAMFTASHARRMVKSDKDSTFQTSVLSPRTAPVLKNGRRTTIGEGRHGGALMAAHAVRLSGTVGGTPKARESVAGVMGKGGWR